MVGNTIVSAPKSLLVKLREWNISLNRIKLGRGEVYRSAGGALTFSGYDQELKESQSEFICSCVHLVQTCLESLNLQHSDSGLS